MKKKKPINPNSSHRLYTLCIDNKVSQAKLAKLASISANTISNIIQGHTAMSDNIAKQIVNVFPQVRTQWLTGEDDYKTEEEYQQHVKELNLWKARAASDDKINGLILILEAERNFKIEEPDVSHPHYLLHDPNGNTQPIPEHIIISLSREISDYVEFRFSRMIRGDTNG